MGNGFRTKLSAILPWAIVILSALWLVSSWRLPSSKPGDFDITNFGKIPVLGGGRVKPLDTVARNSLVIIHGKQTLQTEDGRRLDAIHWLADILFNAPVADLHPAFVINNPEVLGLFGWQQGSRKYFSFVELSPFFEKIDEQGQLAGNIDPSERSPYQNAIFNLRNSLILYQRLKNNLRPEDSESFSEEISDYLKAMPAGLEPNKKNEKKQSLEQAKLASLFTSLKERYETIAELGYFFPIPPAQANAERRGEWQSIGSCLLHAIPSGKMDPNVMTYARIGDAYRANNPALFNQRLRDFANGMAQHDLHATSHASYEFLFNHIEPFYQCMVLYVLAFLLVCGWWMSGNQRFNQSAFYLLLLALALHTFGLASRMYLQGRPPVTNLYSSAIFIGWGTVLIGLILERIFRDGIGSASASVIGFVTLIIAHHLAGSGDTLEMLVAVLDTNLWLATHVVTITLGYSAMFLAGTLAIIYTTRSVFTRSLTPQASQSLTNMIYGVICFATLFSFVGTVLGGIWADQCWGRFWGWDPKENGALLIVLWCAIILHARLNGFIRQRGLIVMSLAGNAITSFSWFGVNMLGVGLHSYGFMNKAFPWLVAFIISQLALMLAVAIPRELEKRQP